MTKAEYLETVAVLRSLLTLLGRSAKANTGVDGANLTYAISVVSTNAATGVAVSDVQACFTLATRAGATLAGMLAIYSASVALAPVTPIAKAMVAYCAAEAVIQCAAILNATTFTSRDDVDAALLQIGAAFDTVESTAGSARQTTLYQALVTLQGATTANLNTLSYPLPRLVTYVSGKTLSALTMAYKLYGDAVRCTEVAAENQVFNPAFMPLTVQVLSA